MDLIDDLPPYLDAEDPVDWPWQLKAFLAAAIALVVEIVVIAVLVAL